MASGQINLQKVPGERICQSLWGLGAQLDKASRRKRAPQYASTEKDEKKIKRKKGEILSASICVDGKIATSKTCNQLH